MYLLIFCVAYAVYHLQAMGIALDTRRIDKVEEVCKIAINCGKTDILGYTFNLCQSARNIRPREFRLEVNYYKITQNNPVLLVITSLIKF